MTEHSRLFLPSITMCGLSGFREDVTEYAGLELDSYLNNTINLDELLYSIEDNDGNLLTIEPFFGTMSDKSGMWKISTTYSAYRGRCYTLEYQKAVHKYIH